MIVLSILISFLLGFVFISFLENPSYMNDNESESNDLLKNIWFKSSLAFGAGVSLSSLMFFLWIKIWGNVHNYQYFEILLALILTAIYVVKRGFAFKMPQKSCIPKTTWFLVVSLVALIVLQIVTSVYSFSHFFLGDWDAVNFWNYNARTFCLLPQIHFSAFAQNAVHADYPLLISSIVAKSWCYIGHFSQISVLILHILFGIAAIVLLTTVLSNIKTKNAGLITGIFLAGNTLYFYELTAFTADAVLSYYFLAGLVLLFYSNKMHNPRMQVLTGFMLASAAWVKNEGVIFLLVVLPIFMLFNLKSVNAKKIKYFLLGFLPVLGVVGFFKALIAHYGIQNDMVAHFNVKDYAARLTDFSRYKLIAKSSFLIFSNIVKPLFFALLLLGTCWSWKPLKNKNVVAVLVSILTMYVVYFFIYVTTYLPLVFHINTSLARLIIQLFPISIFAIALLIKKEAQVNIKE